MWIESRSIASALDSHSAKVDRSGSKLDLANPRMVGGLDLDWIITGNELFTWPVHSLIEAHVATGL